MMRDEALADKRLAKLSQTMEELYERASQNEQILRKYQRFELRLLAIDSFEELLQTLIVDALEHFDLTLSEIWLLDSTPGLIDVFKGDMPEEARLVPASHLKKLFGDLETPEIKLVDWQFIRENLLFAGQEMGSAAILPLSRGGKILGSLHFGARSFRRFSKEMSTDFMQHLGVVAAVAMENAINREQLHRLSLTDALTGVENRRAFHLALDKEISLAQRRREPLSLLLVDLDHFKRINDTYGHQAGDKVLTSVARHIGTMLRKSDHVCRYGGEEFALVLPNCERQLAVDVAERIRHQVSELLLWTDQGQRMPVALSIGISCWEANSTVELDGEVLLRCADKAVYAAKAAGRNCVRFRQLGH
jgi:two-component system cell cycle response regulator